MRTDDGYIIYRCLNGDPDAFGLLVDKYKAGVYALAYSKLRNFHDAQDVSQEVFIRAYKGLHKLRRWESFAAWLYRITYRQCRNWVRAQSKRPDYEFIEDRDAGILDGHSMNSYRSELVAQSVHDALDSLLEMHRQVLTLRYLGGMNSFEIARFVGVSPAVVRRRLVNARAALKAEMLDTMSEVFEEQRLQAIFTLRIAEMVKHIRVQPLPRLAELGWGLSIALGIMIAVLGSGSFIKLQNYMDLAASRATGSPGMGEIPVTFIEQTSEREGDASMLNYKEISAVTVTIAVLSMLSGSTMASETSWNWTWARLADAPVRTLGNGIAELVGGKIYFTGGFHLGNTTLEYDIANDSWSSKALFPHSDGRAGPGSAVFESRIYTFCGVNLGGTHGHNTVDYYDTINDIWVTESVTYPVSDIGGALACVTLGGYIYCMGGGIYHPPNWTYTTNCYKYDPIARNFTPIASKPSAMGGDHFGFAYQGKIWVAGIHVTSDLQVYDPVADSWEVRSGPPTGYHIERIDALPSGQIIAVLVPNTGDRKAQFFQYDPDSDEWFDLNLNIHEQLCYGTIAVAFDGNDIYTAFGGDPKVNYLERITLIPNDPPVADAGGPYDGYEGSPVSFNASASSDPDGDQLKYRWDFDSNGTWDTGWSLDPTATYTWPDDWSGSLTVEVSDGELTDAAIASVTVNNVAPSIPDISQNPNPGLEGAPVTVTVTATDPAGGYDPLTYFFDWESDGEYDEDNNTGVATHTWADDDSDDAYTIKVKVEDGDGGFVEQTFDVVVRNVDPIVDAGNDRSAYEGSPVNLVSTFSDEGELDTHTAVIDWGDGVVEPGIVTESGGQGTVSGEHIYCDNKADGYIVTVTVTDKDGGIGNDALTVMVYNVLPVVGDITAPLNPVQVETEITASADFTDLGTCDTHTATWDWGDGSTSPGTVNESNGSGSVEDNHTYTTAGVYTVTLTVTDDDGGQGQSLFRYVVVYDPSAGFVTGGGWIDSPENAYMPDPSLTGKANFGFVSKYKKGASVPTGNTEFIFHVADMNFHSSEYQWLVVAGAKAKFKGSGTINNTGEYGFMLTATDGDVSGGGGVDKFRIKIWEKEDEAVVYDNQMGDSDDADATDAIEGGSIVIHEGGPAAAPPLAGRLSLRYPQREIKPTVSKLHASYPNPFNPETWIPYQLAENVKVTIRIYSAAGHIIRTLDLGDKPAGFYVSRDRAAYWDGRNEAGEQVSSGTYFYTIQAGDFAATKKMVVAR